MSVTPLSKLFVRSSIFMCIWISMILLIVVQVLAKFKIISCVRFSILWWEFYIHIYKNGVLQYKGINFCHVGCTDKKNKPVIYHIRIFLTVHDLMPSTQRVGHPHPPYIGRELTTDDRMFSNECSGRSYCYRYVCHAHKIVVDIQQ